MEEVAELEVLGGIGGTFGLEIVSGGGSSKAGAILEMTIKA
jgi:hypothetical protein